MIIAIDGPAASGKGTLARRLAAHFGLRHLDTGLVYRAVAARMLDIGVPLEDAAEAEAVARDIDLGSLDRVALSVHEIGEAASLVAPMPAVRAVLRDRQRSFAMEGAGAVLDGRDIGTVVLPDATVKLYVTADIAERARRLTDEICVRGTDAELRTVRADLERRDRRDTGRTVAPLTRARDAYLLDTTGMDIEAAFRTAVDIVNQASAERSRAEGGNA